MSKFKPGAASGRSCQARLLSQDGAVCVIDIGATVLRVNQSKLRRAKDAWNDVVAPQGIPSHFHLLSLCRVSGWIGRVSGQWINFLDKARLRFTGLFLKVPGMTLWSCLTALALVWLCATSRDFELALVCH